MTLTRVIGTGHGGIPWRLPRDVAHFRSYTQGKHLLLGRKTFEEMLGWFSDHHPIVLTENVDYKPKIGRVAFSMEKALSLARASGAEELVVCGGARLYHTALACADLLILTLIEADVKGTALFPDYRDGIHWETISMEKHEADLENEFAMTFLRLKRRVDELKDVDGKRSPR